jgi:hypothetical protein
MSKIFTKVSNPLTIIAIFAGLAEINGTVVLSLVPDESKELFLWFIILFPTLLVCLFFITLNMNPKVIYAPSDFIDEKNFLKTLNINSDNFEAKEINTVVNGKIVKAHISNKSEWNNSSTGHFPRETQEHLKKANIFYDHITSLLNKKIKTGIFQGVGFAVQAPEYFIFNYIFSSEYFNDIVGSNVPRSIIIRITADVGELKLIAIGKNIITPDPIYFSNEVYKLIEKEINNLEKQKNAKISKEKEQD